MKVVSTVVLPTLGSVNRFIKTSKLKQKDIINIYRNADETYVMIFIEQILVAGEREMIEKYKKATPAEKRKFLMEIRRSEKIELRENRKSYKITRKSIIETRKRLEKDLRGN